MTRQWLSSFVCVVALLVVGVAPAAEKKYGPGVSDTEIKIGNSVPYSGPASAYGAYGIAMSAYFKMINEQGGVNGRKITLISLDNGYSPPKALEMTRQLVEHDEVLAIMGTLGTPTNAAIEKYLHEAHVPDLNIISGASRFNDPVHFPWAVPTFYSYHSEAKLYAKYILANKPDAKIAVLYQNDDLGGDYLSGLKDGLGARAQKMIVATVSYEVTDPSIDSQVISLKGSGANVLVEFANAKAGAQAIRKAYDIGWRPLQIAGATGAGVAAALRPAGVEKAVGLISIIGKDPSDPQWADDPDVKAFRAMLSKYSPSSDPNDSLNLLGYSTASTIAEIIRRCGDELTREHLVEVTIHLRGLHTPSMLPGVTLEMSPTDYDGVKQFQPARFNGERYEPLGKMIDLRATD
ncbi:MAG TPA: ABC transporter substrate-binding protein [Candidatus Cybelea sp.]|nr:ABC transporter substrate-binding protein [Candidatus Cybelea sp.]